MSYEFWMLVNQGRQIGLARQQVQQLGAIQNQLVQQQFIQQQQALLAQVLFEAEQFAQRVVAVGSRDPFAAGLLSFLRLRGAADIHPGLFNVLEHKRSWAQITACLEAYWRAAEQMPAFSDLGRRVLSAIEVLGRWQGILGPNYRQVAAQIEEKAGAEAKKRDLLKLLALLFLILIPVGFLIGIIVGVATSEEIGKPLAVILTMAGFVGTALFGALTFEAYGAAKKSAAKAHEIRGQVMQYEAFLASPDGGQLLDFVARQHPALAA